MPDVLDLIHLEPFDSKLEIREEEGTMTARIVPYNETILIDGRPESFVYGSLADIEADGISLFYRHDHKEGNERIGKALDIREEQDGAYATFKFLDTTRAKELYQRVKDGLLKFVSPGFVIKNQTDQGAITKLAWLPEVSLTPTPAYRGATVMAVRETPQEGTKRMEEVTVTEGDPTAVAVDLTELETRSEEQGRAIARIEARLAAPDGATVKASLPTGFEAFCAQLEQKTNSNSMRFRDAFNEKVSALETREIADITGTVGGTADVSGWMVEQYAANELVNILDARRPFASRLTSIPMPKSGVIRWPRLTQHAEVSARGAQKSEIPSQKMVVQTASATHAWLAGGLDVALEAIATGEVDILQESYRDLLKLYARATELDSDLGVVPQIEAGGFGFNYTGSALRTDTYAHFIADVLDASDDYEDAADEVATKLGVSRVAYNALLQILDGQGRRVFAVTNPQNADAQAALQSNSFTIDGTSIEVFKVKGLTNAVLYGPEALKFADSGPTSYQALNVQLMGQDIGVLGRTIFVPKIPEAVQILGEDPES